MHISLLPWLRSPDDGSLLTLHSIENSGDTIHAGTLTDNSGRVFPIDDGIPRLLPENLLAAQTSEIAARDAQVGDYDRMTGLYLFGKVEIPLTLRALSPCPGDRLLEAGCGTGRMTRILSKRVGEMAAVDFSFESLRVCARKLAESGIANVHLAQADLCALPFAPETFDRVLSCQVLEHVPGPDARRRAIESLARVAKPGATLALSAYQHSLITRLLGEKEGEHDGGIPFFRFTRRELCDTLAAAWDVRFITPALVYLHLARCTRA